MTQKSSPKRNLTDDSNPLQPPFAALTAIGLGLIASLFITRALSSLLFAVGPINPQTFLAVALLLLGVALAACYIPASRAMRVDPMAALRYE
jgi:ABC-type antimicrobial peptide transport system permease subunit